MAVANYESTYGSLPPAFIAGPDGRPMHSWRVLLLPFMEQKELYDAYRFDEPWDGPNNAKLAGRIGSVYRRPEDGRDGSSVTRFAAVVGPGTAFPGSRALRYREIGDGRQTTLGFVEIVGPEIPWMEPRDLRFDRMNFRVNDGAGTGIGSPYGGARVLTLDGAVHSLRDHSDPAVLRAMLTANGGEPIVQVDGNWTLAEPPPNRKIEP